MKEKILLILLLISVFCIPITYAKKGGIPNSPHGKGRCKSVENVTIVQNITQITIINQTAVNWTIITKVVNETIVLSNVTMEDIEPLMVNLRITTAISVIALIIAIISFVMILADYYQRQKSTVN